MWRQIPRSGYLLHPRYTARRYSWCRPPRIGSSTTTPAAATPTATTTSTGVVSVTPDVITPSPVPARTPVAKSKCDSGKLNCVAQKQACLLAAHAKAEKKGVQLDGTTVLKCTDKFDGGTKGFLKGCIGKLENKQDARKSETLCAVIGDLVKLESKVDAFVSNAASAIDPSVPTVQPPNDCDAGKTSCVWKKARCLLRAQLKAVTKNLPVDSAAVQKCTEKFDGGSKPEKGCVARLRAKQDARKPKTVCSVPTDDIAALEATVDAFVADIVSEIRPVDLGAAYRR